MLIRYSLFAAAVVLVFASGCGPAKLDTKTTYSMTPGDAQVLDLPAISKAQKVTVEFSSTAGDINVYLIKDFAEKDGQETPPPKDQIMGQKQAKSGSFTVDVPAKTATRVVVRGVNEKTEVTLHVTNAK